MCFLVDVFGTRAEHDALAGVASRGEFPGHVVVKANRESLEPPGACSTKQSPPGRCSMAPLKKFIGRRPDEAGDEHISGVIVEAQRLGDLLDDAVFHHDDAVAHGHGLDLVVGDVDHGGLEPVVELGDFGAHLDAHLGVEVGERFVEQEGLRFAHDGAADGDALALAAGEGLGFALELFVGDAEDLRGVADALVDLGFRVFAQHQAERHVFVDGHVRDRARSFGTPWRCRGLWAAHR